MEFFMKWSVAVVFKYCVRVFSLLLCTRPSYPYTHTPPNSRKWKTISFATKKRHLRTLKSAGWPPNHDDTSSDSEEECKRRPRKGRGRGGGGEGVGVIDMGAYNMLIPTRSEDDLGYYWEGLEVKQSEREDGGWALFATRSFIKPTVILILGSTLSGTEKQMIAQHEKLRKGCKLSHCWHKLGVMGISEWVPSYRNIPSFGLSVTLMANENSSTGKHNMMGYPTYMITASHIDPGDEITVWYGNRYSYRKGQYKIDMESLKGVIKKDDTVLKGEIGDMEHLIDVSRIEQETLLLQGMLDQAERDRGRVDGSLKLSP
jgi:hypothetical protein